MQRILALSLFLAIAFQANSSWATMYKCVDAKGRTTYQGSPCAEQAGSTAQVEVIDRLPGAPLKDTPLHRRYLAQFTAYQTEKVVVEACVNSNSHYSESLAAAFERYYQYAKVELQQMGKGDFNQVCGAQASRFQRLVSGRLEKSANRKPVAGGKQSN